SCKRSRMYGPAAYPWIGKALIKYPYKTTILPLDKQNAPAVINRSTGVIAAADRPVKGHDSRYRAVYLFCGFFLVRLDIACRVCADEDVVHHPPQNRMAAVGDTLFQRQLHQLFGGR